MHIEERVASQEGLDGNFSATYSMVYEGVTQEVRREASNYVSNSQSLPGGLGGHYSVRTISTSQQAYLHAPSQASLTPSAHPHQPAYSHPSHATTFLSSSGLTATQSNPNYRVIASAPESTSRAVVLHNGGPSSRQAIRKVSEDVAPNTRRALEHPEESFQKNEELKNTKRAFREQKTIVQRQQEELDKRERFIEEKEGEIGLLKQREGQYGEEINRLKAIEASRTQELAQITEMAKMREAEMSKWFEMTRAQDNEFKLMQKRVRGLFPAIFAHLTLFVDGKRRSYSSTTAETLSRR